MRWFWEVFNYSAIVLTFIMVLLSMAMMFCSCSWNMTDGGVEMRFRETEHEQEAEDVVRKAIETWDFYRYVRGLEDDPEPEWLRQLREQLEAEQENNEENG